MVITKREYILATCFLSGAAAVISFVSLGTQYWVVSDGRWTVDGLDQPVYIRYGLFSGIFRRSDSITATYQIEMTCLIDKNVCAMLCGSSDTRSSQLESIYNDQTVNFDTSCPQIRSVDSLLTTFVKDTTTGTYDKRFINAGVWLTTIIFLILSAVMGCLSAALAVWNTVTNPIQVYLSVYGLYIYNAIALGFIVIVLLLWGIMFTTTTIHNAAILYTLTGEINSNNLATLGYSYWLNFAPIILYIISICLLYVRQYLIERQPKVDVHLEGNADPGLFLF